MQSGAGAFTLTEEEINYTFSWTPRSCLGRSFNGFGSDILWIFICNSDLFHSSSLLLNPPLRLDFSSISTMNWARIY